MNLNLTDSQRSHMGAVNLDAFFCHINALVDNPAILEEIPGGTTFIFRGTGDTWVDQQNDLLAEQSESPGRNVCRIGSPNIFSLTFPDGRQVSYKTDYFWPESEICQLTKLTARQVRFLEKEKAVVPTLDEKNRLFTFSQLLQMQAYKLIKGTKSISQGFGQDKDVNLKRADLQKLLGFYADYYLKGDIYQHVPMFGNGQVFLVAPDISNSKEVIDAFASMNWRSQNQITFTLYPSLFDVFKQLCENAWTLRDKEVWTQAELEQRLMVVAA
jgi:hypothetical protein